MIFESFFCILYASGFQDFDEKARRFYVSCYESDSDHESDLRTRLAAQRSEHTRALEETKRTHAHELQALKQELATKVQTERSHQEQLAAMRRQLQQQVTQIETHRKALADKDAAHAIVLAAKDDTIEAHVRTLAAKQDECQALLDDQTESNQLFEALEVQFNAKDERIDTLSEEKDRLEAELIAQTGLTDAERRQKLALEERIAGLERTTEESKRLAHQTKEDAEKKTQTMRTQLTQTRKALAQQEQEKKAMVDVLSVQTKQTEKIAQDLKQAQIIIEQTQLTTKDLTAKHDKQKQKFAKELDAQNKQHRLDQEKYEKRIQQLAGCLQEQGNLLCVAQSKTHAEEQEKNRLTLERLQMAQHKNDDIKKQVTSLSGTDDQDTLSMTSSFSFVEPE